MSDKMCTKLPNTRWKKNVCQQESKVVSEKCKSNNSGRPVGAFSRYLLYQVLCVNTKEIKTVRGSRSAGVNG